MAVNKRMVAAGLLGLAGCAHAVRDGAARPSRAGYRRMQVWLGGGRPALDAICLSRLKDAGPLAMHNHPSPSAHPLDRMVASIRRVCGCAASWLSARADAFVEVAGNPAPRDTA